MLSWKLHDEQFPSIRYREQRTSRSAAIPSGPWAPAGWRCSSTGSPIFDVVGGCRRHSRALGLELETKGDGVGLPVDRLQRHWPRSSIQTDDTHDHSSSIGPGQGRHDGFRPLAVGDGVGQMIAARQPYVADGKRRRSWSPSLLIDHDMPGGVRRRKTVTNSAAGARGTTALVGMVCRVSRALDHDDCSPLLPSSATMRPSTQHDWAAWPPPCR